MLDGERMKMLLEGANVASIIFAGWRGGDPAFRPMLILLSSPVFAGGFGVKVLAATVQG
ncbi:hypothetical protein [Synechococcus sp. WH 8016]|uniref:hypothetical protein n=1 Tax=Synechococcus sp. WH 8016 TaxID=166318 RepID=UPI00022D9B7B|nr:hypothetical protein [Synechococcus sp. WH 8016]EHA63065.1 hypothetical protein Syn8016DRAFT_0106 [Synechococcus sp. WH 8016]